MAGLSVKARRWIGTHPIAAMCLLTALCLVVNLLAQWAMGIGFYRFDKRFLLRSPFRELHDFQPWGLAIWAVLSAAAVSVIRLRAGLSVRPLVIGLLWNVPLCAAASVLLDIVGHKIAGGQTDNFLFWFSPYHGLENSLFAAVLAIISGGHCIGITVSLLYSRYRMRTGKWEMMGVPPTNSNRLPGRGSEGKRRKTRKSIRTLLLVTLIATVVVAGVFVVVLEPPPTMSIHQAVGKHELEEIRRNFRWGADINSRTDRGLTPLHYANNNKGIADMLIAKGADVNARDNDGRTPLHVVRNKDVAELLIAKGADVNAKDNDGRTPLHYVRNKDVAELLIAKGVDVNAKDDWGRTPLHWAALNGKNTVELLIAKGADVNAEDINGKTPLALALAEGHDDIADLLRRHGARAGGPDGLD